MIHFDDYTIEYGSSVNGTLNEAGDTRAHGWFSGEEDGDGVPIDGYEEPKGTGIKYGRYWD